MTNSKDPDGPVIVTTALGERLFTERLKAMRLAGHTVRTPRFVIVDDPGPDLPDAVRHLEGVQS